MVWKDGQEAGPPCEGGVQHQSSLPYDFNGSNGSHSSFRRIPGVPFRPQYAYVASQSLRHGEFTGLSRPLIEKVTNRWQEVDIASNHGILASEDREPRFCDLEEDESCPNITKDAIKSRRFRRMAFTLLILLAIVLYGWKWHVRPRIQRNWDLMEGFMALRSNGTYGWANGGDFDGTFIKDLDSKVLPGGESDPHGRKRLIFVGDIHGCQSEFVRLIKDANFDQNFDHVIAVGDVISKGPDNVGVLNELIRMGAESVRGNHEDRILLSLNTFGDSGSSQSEASTSTGSHKDARIIRSLGHKHIKYLRSMPLMIRVPALPQAKKASHKDKDRIAEEIMIVHAGLVPHVPSIRQDPYFVMNMRSIDRITHIPSAQRKTKKGHSKPWIEIWNWYNDRLNQDRSLPDFHDFESNENAAGEGSQGENFLNYAWGALTKPAKSVKRPTVVIYGHDSKAGLQMHRWSKGLDSACVSGGKLTALILDATGKTELVQVGCKNYR